LDYPHSLTSATNGTTSIKVTGASSDQFSVVNSESIAAAYAQLGLE